MNIGLAKFDNNTSCADDDFSYDSAGNCYGMDVLFTPGGYADWPGYEYTSSSEKNQEVLDFILDPAELDPDGHTPIASSLHDFSRYMLIWTRRTQAPY